MSYFAPIGRQATQFVKPTSIGGRTIQQYADDFVNFFKNLGKQTTTTSTISKTKALRDIAVSTGVVASIGFITTTPTGEQIVKSTDKAITGSVSTVNDITKFFTQNPLLVAGLIILGALVVIKK